MFSFRDYDFLKCVPDTLLKLARIACPCDATKFIGIPPYVTLIDDMERLRHKFNALRADIKSNTQEMMDERGVGGSEYRTKQGVGGDRKYQQTDGVFGCYHDFFKCCACIRQ